MLLIHTDLTKMVSSKYIVRWHLHHLSGMPILREMETDLNKGTEQQGGRCGGPNG